MKKTVIPIIVVVMLCSIMYSEMGNTTSNIPPVSRTGAPSEGNCSGCHSGNLNTGGGSMIFSMESLAFYIPDSTYTTTLQVVDGSKTRYGFQLTALDGNNNGIGTFTITNTTNTSAQSNLGRGYVNQKNANSNDTWSFDWTAPSSDVGPITFYLCGNATDNNSSTSGDNVYLRAITVQSCGITIADSVAGSLGDSSGIIDITVTDALPPLTYLWSNGSTSEDLTGLDSGDYTVVVSDSSGCTGTATINVPFTVGVDESLSALTFAVFPNPTSGHLRIKSTIGHEQTLVSMYNLQGRLVLKQQELMSDGSLDLSAMPAGIYTLLLSNDEEVRYKKIVIY